MCLAKKREMDHVRSYIPRELVDESELGCCLLSDSRCQDLVIAQVAKRAAVAKRTLVDESELACCLL